MGLIGMCSLEDQSNRVNNRWKAQETMLTKSIGKSIRFIGTRNVGSDCSGTLRARLMATAVDPTTISPSAPKALKPKQKGWERATFTIRVLNRLHQLLLLIGRTGLCSMAFPLAPIGT